MSAAIRQAERGCMGTSFRTHPSDLEVGTFVDASVSPINQCNCNIEFPGVCVRGSIASSEAEVRRASRDSTPWSAASRSRGTRGRMEGHGRRNVLRSASRGATRLATPNGFTAVTPGGQGASTPRTVGVERRQLGAHLGGTRRRGPPLEWR